MNNIEHTVRSRFPDLVLLGCVLGFMGILIELYSIEHFQRGSQIIGFLSTIAGLIVSALGFVPSLRKVVVPLLALLTLTARWSTARPARATTPSGSNARPPPKLPVRRLRPLLGRTARAARPTALSVPTFPCWLQWP